MPDLTQLLPGISDLLLRILGFVEEQHKVYLVWRSLSTTNKGLGDGAIAALSRERLFEMGPVSRVRCRACIRVDDDSRAVFCQCSQRRVEGEDFCAQHSLPSRRKLGEWEQSTGLCTLATLAKKQALAAKHLKAGVKVALQRSLARCDCEVGVRAPDPVVNALSVVLLRSGVDAANETIYEQLSAELSGDFDFDLERMKADIDAALPELRDEVRLNAFKVECSNGESVDGERLRNVARLVVADDGLQKSLLDDLVTKLVSRLEGIGLEVCEKDVRVLKYCLLTD